MRRPEYVHVLLNPLPVYATALGVLALVFAVMARSTAAKVIALAIVLVGCLAVWPVNEYGERAEHQTEEQLDKDSRAWLHAHAGRAETFALVFYATAVLAVVTMVAVWKFPKAGGWLTAVTLVAAVVCVVLGGWISHAGGRIRHMEFRTGPPPVVSDHDDH